MIMMQSEVYQADPSILPDMSHIVTEDDTPVDNYFSERQQRLLPHVLFVSWKEGRPFEAASDVGLFYGLHKPPVVPDFMLSLKVSPIPFSKATESKSYFVWVQGKPPDLTIEIVSNKEGGELSTKMQLYAHVRVTYYAVYDPFGYIQDVPLQVFELRGGHYEKLDDYAVLPQIGLGLTIWDGIFDEQQGEWLRFVRPDGSLLLTGEELAAAEKANADAEKANAEAERANAEAQKVNAETEKAKADAEKAKAEEALARADAAEQRVAELERKLRELEGH